MSKRILAIDPGKGGGIAWINALGVRQAVRMPKTDQDIIDLFIEIRKYGNPEACFMEEIRSYGITKVNEEGKREQIGSPSSIGKMCDNYGFLRAIVMFCGIPLHIVSPPKWQKVFSLGKRKDHPGNKWKNHLKNKAQQLFPDQAKITLNTCDALLILEYGIRKS